MKVKVYQATIETDYKFRPYEDAEGKLSKGDYKCVFDGEVDDRKDYPYDGGRDKAEYLFEVLNIGNRPNGYKGHSLSVSDIVEVDGDTFYCNDFGWVQLDTETWEEIG